MHLAGCTQEEAEQALRECNGEVIDAIDKIMKVPKSLGAPKKKELDETQKKFAEMRMVTSSLNKSIEDSFGTKQEVVTKTDQHGSPSCLEKNYNHIPHSPPLWSDSHHIQQSQIPSLESTEQKQETACPSLSE